VILGPEDRERVKQMEASRMSWCASDVLALHGETGIYDQTDASISNGKVPVIYPDMNPRGVILPEEVAPPEEGKSLQRDHQQDQTSEEWMLTPQASVPRENLLPKKIDLTQATSGIRMASIDAPLPAYSNLTVPRDGELLTRLPPLSSTEQQPGSKKGAPDAKPRPSWMRWFGAGRN